MMTFTTWQRISDQHTRYMLLLDERVKASEGVVERCTTLADMPKLHAVIKLGERVHRHMARMERHVDKGMQLIEPGGAG